MIAGTSVLTTVIAAAAALASPPPREGSVKTDDGLTLRYRIYGHGPQAIVVPLGFFLERDFKRFAHPSRTLVFYDQRNRGRSEVAPPDRSTLAHEVRDMETLRAHLRLPKITTVGYSYLGLMTVMYAMEHEGRVERLVQLGPVARKFGTSFPPDQKNDAPPEGLLKEKVEESERLRREGFTEKDPRAYCERDWELTRLWLVGDPAKAASLGPSHCDLPNEWPVNLRKQWAHRMPLMQKLDLPVDRIAKVTQTVLTIHGTKDRNAPYGAGREWASLLPNARLVTVHGAAHQSWADDPELVFGAIEDFLQGRWPSKAERISR